MTCGEGVNTRTRGCNSPPPSEGGADCPGEETDTAVCSLEECRQEVEIPLECGLSDAIAANRITNGKPARRNAWPWQVAIGSDHIQNMN